MSGVDPYSPGMAGVAERVATAMLLGFLWALVAVLVASVVAMFIVGVCMVVVGA